MERISEFVVGLLFGIGLILAGMTDPAKVIGFLDLAGAWDPSLAFVMGAPFWWGCSRLVWPRSAPPACLAARCSSPPRVTSIAG